MGEPEKLAINIIDTPSMLGSLSLIHLCQLMTLRLCLGHVDFTRWSVHIMCASMHSSAVICGIRCPGGFSCDSIHVMCGDKFGIAKSNNYC
jgi:hypothetical protein